MGLWDYVWLDIPRQDYRCRTVTLHHQNADDVLWKLMHLKMIRTLLYVIFSSFKKIFQNTNTLNKSHVDGGEATWVRRKMHTILCNLSLLTSHQGCQRNHNLRDRTIWTVVCTAEMFLSRNHMQITSEQTPDVWLKFTTKHLILIKIPGEKKNDML